MIELAVGLVLLIGGAVLFVVGFWLLSQLIDYLAGYRPMRTLGYIVVGLLLVACCLVIAAVLGQAVMHPRG